MVKEWKKPFVKWVVLDESDIIATSGGVPDDEQTNDPNYKENQATGFDVQSIFG